VRFTALPSIKAPVAVYLGAVHGGRAAFALNRVATASGPARCATMRGPYEAVYLKPGQTERVSIPWFGTTLSMQLALVHLKAQNAASPHAARVANHRVAKGGRALLAQHHLLGTMHFSTLQGFLRAPAKTHACS
jgi:hypothetical protein